MSTIAILRTGRALVLATRRAGGGQRRLLATPPGSSSSHAATSLSDASRAQALAELAGAAPPRAGLVGRLLGSGPILELSQHAGCVRVLPYIGNAGYLALASGFLMTDILALRVLLIGGYSGLVCYHALHQNPLRIPLLWSLLFVGVNAAAAFALASDRFPPPFSDEDTKLHADYFPQVRAR